MRRKDLRQVAVPCTVGGEGTVNAYRRYQTKMIEDPCCVAEKASWRDLIEPQGQTTEELEVARSECFGVLRTAGRRDFTWNKRCMDGGTP